MVFILGILFGASIFALTQPAYFYLMKKWAEYQRVAEIRMGDLFISDISPTKIFVVIAAINGIMVLFVGIIFMSLSAVIAGLIVGIVTPLLLYRRLVRRRRDRLASQLLDGLITLANGMRAGLNLPQSIGLIEKHAPKPLRQEFAVVLREIEHGTAVDVALNNAGRRIKNHNFRLLFAALKTTRKRGGNIPQTLDKLRESLREIIRLEEKVKAMTAQGRTTAIMMGLMPLVFLFIFWLIDREGVMLLFTDSIGQSILALVVFLDLAGFLWIRKIVSFEI